MNRAPSSHPQIELHKWKHHNPNLDAHRMLLLTNWCATSTCVTSTEDTGNASCTYLSPTEGVSHVNSSHLQCILSAHTITDSPSTWAMNESIVTLTFLLIACYIAYYLMCNDICSAEDIGNELRTSHRHIESGILLSNTAAKAAARISWLTCQMMSSNFFICFRLRARVWPAARNSLFRTWNSILEREQMHAESAAHHPNCFIKSRLVPPRWGEVLLLLLL